MSLVVVVESASHGIGIPLCIVHVAGLHTIVVTQVMMDNVF